MNEREKAKSIFTNANIPAGGNGEIKNLNPDFLKSISIGKGYATPEKTPEKSKNGYVSSKTGYSGKDRNYIKSENQPRTSGRISDSGSSFGAFQYTDRASYVKTDGRGNYTSAQDYERPHQKRNYDSSRQQERIKTSSPERGKQAQRQPQGKRTNTNQLQRTNQSDKKIKSEKKSLPRKPHGKAQLTKKEQKQIKKQKELYERARKGGMSGDEIKREQQKKQIAKRKAGMVLTFAATVLVILGAIGAFLYHSVAIVDNITVEGSGASYSAKQIIKQSGIKKGDKLLGISEKRLRDDLTASMPYIKDVEIKRTLPDKVVIVVTSTEDKMLISNKNKHIRLDIDGKVLSNAKTKLKDGIYKIEGMKSVQFEPGDIFVPDKDDTERYEKAKQIVAAADKTQGLTTGVIDITDLENISFIYQSRIKIYLGDGGDIESKLGFAMQTISDAASKGEIGYIDMRFSERGYLSLGSMDNK